MLQQQKKVVLERRTELGPSLNSSSCALLLLCLVVLCLGPAAPGQAPQKTYRAR